MSVAHLKYPIKREGTVFLTLRPFESHMAGNVGLARNLSSIMKGHKHDPPLLNNSYAWMNHVEGAGAECTVAKHTGKFWDGSFGTFTEKPDVGPYHVKWVMRKNGRLRIPLKRPPDALAIFVLVRGSMPDYEMVGWLRAGEGMKDEYIDDPNNRGAEYFVNQDLLHDMADLPDE